jgi:hypothetical protein
MTMNNKLDNYVANLSETFSFGPSYNLYIYKKKFNVLKVKI